MFSLILKQFLISAFLPFALKTIFVKMLVNYGLAECRSGIEI